MAPLSIYPVDRGTEFADGPPKQLTGPDAIDRIRMSVAQGIRADFPWDAGD